MPGDTDRKDTADAGASKEEQKEAATAAEAKAEALREKVAGKATRPEVDEEDEDEEDFDADVEADDDDDDSSSSDEEAGGEAELGDLAADEAGPSSGMKRKKTADPGDAPIVEGESGDEVDPGLIVADGRRARRAAATAARAKYSAAAQHESDEDEW